MNEGRTTAIFGSVATVALVLAWISKPATISNEKEIERDRVGEAVLVGFDDPEAASSLQILKYDEDLAQLKRFEVARDEKSQLWKLPSNDDYPADAAEQVRDAVTPLVGLEVLAVESSLRGDHELFGVVNPDDEELAVGTSGVGMLVRFKDQENQVLASLIIGKEVDQAEGQRYVRIPTEDAVYKVELDIGAFKTDFRDWIEGELLGVRSFDIAEVGVRDYELQQQSLSRMALIRNFDATMAYDSAGSSWSLKSLQNYEEGSPVPAELAENEELNSTFLNDLRTSVQDLEIIDVKRKPNGLAADLKADETLLQNDESITSLQNQGFYPAAGQDGTEIFAAGGETIIGTADGVNYVLRFGEATASLSSGSGEGGNTLSRYLLVTARLDQSKFPAPDLEPLPETVEEMLVRENPPEEPPVPNAATPADDGVPPGAGEVAPENPVAVPAKLDEATKESGEDAKTPSEDGDEQAAVEGESKVNEASTNEDESASEPSAGDGDSPAGSNGGDEPTADPEEPLIQDGESPQSESTEQQDSTEPSAQKDPEKAADDVQVDAPEAAQPVVESPAAAGQESGETEEELKERLEAVRDQITRDNQRLIDERKEKIEAARKQVQELNAKFSEWFYVVSDDVYKKLKITREDLIKTAESEAAADLPNFSEGVPGLQGLQLPRQ